MLRNISRLDFVLFTIICLPFLMTIICGRLVLRAVIALVLLCSRFSSPVISAFTFAAVAPVFSSMPSILLSQFCDRLIFRCLTKFWW